MKKRVYSSSDRVGIVQLDIKKQQKQQGHKHHSRCPLPKPSRPDSSANKQHLKNVQTSLDIKIKELKTPILNEMNLLISNFISSSDRIQHYIHPEEHKHSVNIYHQDRKKLLHYLNSLVVRPVDLGQVKARLKAGKAKPEIEESYYMNAKQELPTQEQLGKEVETIKVQVEQAVNRKRSKSSMAQLEKDMSAAKAKLLGLEKRKQSSSNEQLSSFLKLCHKFKVDLQFKENNPQSQHKLGHLRAQRDKESAKIQNLVEQVTHCRAQLQGLKTKFASIELLLFKFARILNQSISQGNQTNQVCSIEKSKIEQLAKALTETLNYLHPQTDASNDLMQKLKNQVQTMVLRFRQLRKRQLQLLKEKQKALEDLRQYKLQPRKEQCLNQDYKVHIQRLNNDIADLLHDIQRKDQLIQNLRQEKTHIHQDIKSTQEHIEQTQQNYRNLCRQLEEIVEKLKKYQSLLQGKDQQIEQLRLEIKNKNLLIEEKNDLISEKQSTIYRLQAFNIQAQSNKQNLNNQWLTSNIEYQSRLKQREEKIIRLQRQMTQLQGRISRLKQENEKILILEDSTEEKFVNLQLRIEALQNQNYQLYSDVRQSQKIQEKLQENNATYQLLYKQLQHQCDNNRQEIQQNRAKIRFYEQKVMQLAQLAAEQIKFMHSQNQPDNSGPAVQLEVIKESAKGQDDSKEKQEDVMFNWNGQPRSDTKSERSDQYFPFLLQNQVPSPKSSDHSKKSLPDLLKPANSRQLEHSGASALSHYDILVINENMDTIDTHKALYQKNKQEIKNSNQQVVPLVPQKDVQPQSNLAENSQSHDLLPVKDIKNLNKKQGDIIFNKDALRQQIQKRQLIDAQRQPEINNTLSQSESSAQRISIEKVQLEDFDKSHVKKASQIKKLQQQNQKIMKKKNNRQKKRLRSCQNKGNVYIRLKRQGSQISTTNGDRHQRSKSCFDKQQ